MLDTIDAEDMHFNSRPSARGDADTPAAPKRGRGNFNSRPSARGDMPRHRYGVKK